MIDDPNIEYEQSPEYDEDGNRIWYMTELDDVDEFTSYNFDTPPETIPDGYYDTVWSKNTSVASLSDTDINEEELTDSIDVVVENTNTNYSDEQGQLNAAERNYNSAADKIIEILTNVLQKGEITGEDNADLLDAQRELSIYDTLIKNICNKQQTESYQLELQRMKENAAPTTIDGILNILTDGGTKPWLYKDDNNNVLVDMQSIPELTMLVHKLNLIATGGDDEQAEIQLTPEFINMVVKESDNGNSVKSVETKYYLSTSREELIGGSWVDQLPSTAAQKDKFLWYKIVTTYMDAEKEPTETDPVCISTKEEFDGYTMLLMKDTIVVTCDENGNLIE